MGDDARNAVQYELDLYSDLPMMKDVLRGILHTIFFHRYFSCIEPLTFDVFDLTISAANDPNLEILITSRAQQFASSAALAPRNDQCHPIGDPKIKPVASNNADASSANPGSHSQPGGSNSNSVISGAGSFCGSIVVRFYEKVSASSGSSGSAADSQSRGSTRKKSTVPGSGVAAIQWLAGGLTGQSGYQQQQQQQQHVEVCFEEWLLNIRLAATPRSDSERARVRRRMAQSLRKAASEVVAHVINDKDHIPQIFTSETNPFPYQIILNPQTADSQDNNGGKKGSSQSRGMMSFY